MSSIPELRFDVAGPPVTKQRARRGFDGRTKKWRWYTPGDTREYESRVQDLAGWQMMQQKFPQIDRGVPVELVLTLVFERPEELGAGGRVWHVDDPDTSNCLKSIEDGMNPRKIKVGGLVMRQGGVYYDDCQIARHVIEKFYGATGEEPHAEVTIRRLAPVTAPKKRKAAR